VCGPGHSEAAEKETIMENDETRRQAATGDDRPETSMAHFAEAAPTHFGGHDHGSDDVE
jgi:hypothetical protein